MRKVGAWSCIAPAEGEQPSRAGDGAILRGFRQVQDAVRIAAIRHGAGELLFGKAQEAQYAPGVRGVVVDVDYHALPHGAGGSVATGAHTLAHGRWRVRLVGERTAGRSRPIGPLGGPGATATCSKPVATRTRSATGALVSRASGDQNRQRRRGAIGENALVAVKGMFGALDVEGDFQRLFGRERSIQPIAWWCGWSPSSRR